MNHEQYRRHRQQIEQGDCIGNLLPLVQHFQSAVFDDYLARNAADRLLVVLAKLNAGVDMESSRKHALRVMDRLFAVSQQ